ncbi:hypothetical protein D9M73_141700 [compost metagenome]
MNRRFGNPDSVLDHVLHQGLKQERRDGHVCKLLRKLQRHLQPGAKSQPLDAEIGLVKTKFLA